MRLIIIATFILCLFNNCSSKLDCKNETFIDEFTKGDFGVEIPPVNSHLYFFCNLGNNKILSTRNYILYHLYQKSFNKKYSNFSQFSCALYSDKVILKWENFKSYDFENSEISELDKGVKEEYNSMGINEIINKYFVDSSKTDLIMKTQSNQNITFSILYFMFLNQYYITYSDYEGYFKCAKKL